MKPTNKLMKRLSLYLFLLLFTLQTPSQADDIRDYEIEGLSIGSSALDHISEEIIKKNTWNYYKDKTFTPIQINHLSFFKTYDAIDINYKTDDKNYIIHGLSGIIMYQNNINDCYKKMDKIVLELSKVFEDEVKQEKKKLYHFMKLINLVRVNSPLLIFGLIQMIEQVLLAMTILKKFQIRIISILVL